MKKVLYKIIIIRLVFLVLIIASCNTDKQLAEIEKSVGLAEISEDSLPQPEVREAITFILGRDKNENNKYYEEATNYYAFNPEGKTEHLITNLRSLKEVIDFLKKYRPANGMPWGLVNLVSHGNQWMGLSAKVTPESKRSTSDRILEFIERKELTPVPKEILDEKSVIFIHGCGIGHNSHLLKTIATAFSGKENKVTVRASKLYEYYTSKKHKL